MKLQISNCKKAAVQDGMIGLFFEDINYAADGGLYAEMIETGRFPLWTVTGTWEIIILSLHGAMAGMRPKNVVRAAWSM